MSQQLKLKPHEVMQVLTQEYRQARQRLLRAIATWLAVLVVSVPVAVAFSWLTDDVVAGPICFIMVLIFSFLVVVATALSERGRFKHKVGFIEQLMTLFADELHPTEKVTLTLDTTSYRDSRKQVWSGRSRHGNPKAKYEDEWLVVRLMLADHTIVKVRRRAGVKTRKGGIMKEKRRAKITVRPDPRMYEPIPDFVAEGMGSAVERAVRESMHDPPEGLDARPSLDDGEVHVRILQLDAPILPSEVVATVRAVLSELAILKKPAA